MTLNTTLLTDTFNQWRLNTNAAIAVLNNLGTYNAINIIGGNINGVNITLSNIDSTPIGANTPAVGVFTNLSANGVIDLSGASSLIVGAGQISGNAITGGTITNSMVTLSGPPTLSTHATTKAYVDAFMSFTSTFDRIAVTGQSTVSATTPTDIVTFVAGSGMTITTNAGLQTITFNVAGLGGLASLSVVDLTTNVTGVLPIANGGTNSSTVSGARTNLGLGTAALLNVGTGANMVVQLNGLSQLPAVSGALLTNLPTAGYALLASSQTFSGGQRTLSTAVSSSGGITNTDFNLTNDFTTTLTENTQIANPSNVVAGQKGRIAITQGATARTVSYGSSWKFSGGSAPMVSVASGALDVLYYDVIDASHIVANLVKGFA